MTYKLFIENIWKQLSDKFLKQGNDQDEVDYYLSLFRKYKDKFSDLDFKDAINYLSISVSSPKDVFSYKTFNDLKKVVEFLKSIEDKKNADVEVTVKPADPIYKDNNIEIYLGSDKQSCIAYSTGYNWCISETDSSNYFYNYRLDDEATIYFVKDLEKLKKRNRRKHSNPKIR